jgi:hypothetical protein
MTSTTHQTITALTHAPQQGQLSKKGPKGKQTLEKLMQQHTLQLKNRNQIKLYYLLAFFLAGGAAFMVDDVDFVMLNRVLCYLFFEHIKTTSLTSL